MKYSEENLLSMTVKELLVLPEARLVKGRHDMRKAELVAAIVNQQPKEEVAVTFHNSRPKSDYINNAKIGMIVAFRVNNVKVLSGMIEEIHRNSFAVSTKSGVKFTVEKSNIIWVKTGSRWPKGVYLLLKGGIVSYENTGTNIAD
jgi:hypothetical protein